MIEWQSVLWVGLIWGMIGYSFSPAIFTRKGYPDWIGSMIGLGVGFFGGIILLAPLWYFLPDKNAEKTENRQTLTTILITALIGMVLSVIILFYEPLIDPLGAIGLSEVVIQFMLINAILGISIYVTLYGGMFSLANAGFMGIGAYVAVILTQTYDWGFWSAVIAGAIAAGIVAIPVGLPVLRLRDIYLAIATIGFGEVVRIVILNFDKLIEEGYVLLNIDGEPSKITNGALGITLPKLTSTGQLITVLIILSYFLVRLQRSRFGRALAAIRQDENVAASMGIHVVYYKNAAFIIGAVIAGLAGGLHGHLIRIIQPSTYDFGKAVDILAYAVLGGITSWFGPIIGGMTLTALPEMLRGLNEYTGLINGIVLLIFIAYLPGGIGDPELWKSVGRTFQRLRNPEQR